MKRMLFGTLVAAAASLAIAMPSTASATEPAAASSGAVVAPCHPSHDPLMECVRKTVETITSTIAPPPDPVQLACQVIFGRPCIAEETAALSARSSRWACDRPVDCVEHLLFWIATYDPCLLCDEGATKP